ncbi:MAG TPA: DUF2510 domain-containing protein [Amnibacterium sp.]|uniref:DUF2510 domain-containing protein n=1 Tax=Amnibacterium sp. TaxID=1872496 RepID=UPI002F92A957
MTDTAVQPGWYDDPDNRDDLRWWDGAGWSEHRKRDAGSGLRDLAYAVPSSASAPGASTPGGRMRYADRERAMRRNNPFAYAAILLALIGAIFDLFALPGLVAIGLAIAGLVRTASFDARVVRYRGFTTAVIALILGVLATVSFTFQVLHALH